jgi:hypothetical protein
MLLDQEANNMTYAEQTAAAGERDDLHMIYEMGPTSQYEDGSVLNCLTMTTYTPEEVAAGIEVPAFGVSAKRIRKDLQRNARAAIKNGKTENRAPFVNW